MYEVIFLWVLALMFIIFAVVQDIKTREICNWISFSLIIAALGFRFFYSLFENNFWFLLQGIIGLAIFFALGNILYYSRIFAGGDAKLMIALGTILPFSSNFSSNLSLFFNFMMIFLAIGFLYTILSSIVLCLKNFNAFKREFFKQFKKNKKLMIFVLIFSIFLLFLGFIESLSALLGVFIFFISYLYLYSKAVDEACMVKKIRTEKLREGDWLYSDVKIGRKMIKAKWDGLTNQEIKELKKRYKEVKIREGVPFSPVFLISLIIVILFFLLKINLWNPFW
ncbi:Preflagellin peptidase [uncultured archaeon]|nr:Preflagellin peptidase [uncultured archaeon]